MFKRGIWALLPLVVFMAVYLVTSIVSGDFYAMPIGVAFLLASVVAVAQGRGEFGRRVAVFSEGAADSNIMLMVWIFIMAGAFAQSANVIGAVDATVNFTLSLLPQNLVMVGLFLAACLVSLAVGTSVGTIVALVPIAVGIAGEISSGSNAALPMLVAAVVSGAFFGDNLSFISDTTIAATQTQHCAMNDKFKVNALIVLPAALIVCAIYVLKGADMQQAVEAKEVNYWLLLPYLSVIALSVIGINVLQVLIVGIILNFTFGAIVADVELLTIVKACGNGIEGMGTLIIVTLLAGGMLKCIQVNGGIDYIMRHLKRFARGKRSAELVVMALVGMANMCTANNTIAIITVGNIAHNIGEQFGIQGRRIASVMDTTSCFVQGLIPYGAQLLMASALTGLSALEFIPNLYYTWLIGVVTVMAIVTRYPKFAAK